MTDALTMETRRSERGIAGLLIVQAVAYVLLISLSVFVGLGIVPIEAVVVAALAVVVVFLVCWPLRGTMVDRIISLVTAVLSVAMATTILGEITMYPVVSAQEAMRNITKAILYPYGRWAAAFMILLVALTIVGFARQMAREHRTHLVRALSHSLTSGVVSASVAGWVFLPDLMVYVQSGSQEVNIALAIVVGVGLVLGIAMAAASCLWWKEADPDPLMPAPWVGFALIPVLLFGLVSYGMSLTMLIIFGW